MERHINDIHWVRAISLYWTEGNQKTRGIVAITNTDYRILRIFTDFLIKELKQPKQRISVFLYVHSYHDIIKCTEYWSNKLGIDKSRFKKPYIKKDGTRKYQRYNGVATVRICSTSLKERLKGMIDRLSEYRLVAQ